LSCGEAGVFAGDGFVESLVFVVGFVGVQYSGAAPVLDGGGVHAEVVGDLGGGEQSVGAESARTSFSSSAWVMGCVPSALAPDTHSRSPVATILKPARSSARETAANWVTTLPSTTRSRVSNPRWRSKAFYSATDFPASAQTLVPSGAKARAHANIAAIELLGRLRAAGRPAAPAEQRVLAVWSGWGAVPEAFDRRDNRFTAERDRLRELLSREEYQRAEASMPSTSTRNPVGPATKNSLRPNSDCGTPSPTSASFPATVRLWSAL
jgi:hypothetical protein